MIERFFDDPRHRRSEELAFNADRAERKREFRTARHMFTEAAQLEQANAAEVPNEYARVRSVLAISAVTLWLRAHRWNEAAAASCQFLANPGGLTEQGNMELRALLERAWRSGDAQRDFGAQESYASIDVSLSGRRVGFGMAPTNVIASWRAVLPYLLFRVADWKAGLPYRRGGPSRLASYLQLLDASAMSGSYVLRYIIGDNEEFRTSKTDPVPSDVVGAFFELSEAAAKGPEHLAKVVQEPEYVGMFLQAFRDLSPDGVSVGTVKLHGIAADMPLSTATLTPDTRAHLDRALGAKETKTRRRIVADGVLKTVSLKAWNPKVGLVVDGRTMHFAIDLHEHEKTIGGKLNHRVRVVGWESRTAYGVVERFAERIDLLSKR